MISKLITYTGYTQKNGAVSIVNKGKPHHSFVYTLYIVFRTVFLKLAKSLMMT
jgi:hypothetical protein